LIGTNGQNFSRGNELGQKESRLFPLPARASKNSGVAEWEELRLLQKTREKSLICEDEYSECEWNF
jgi:hypothetical protein